MSAPSSALSGPTTMVRQLMLPSLEIDNDNNNDNNNNDKIDDKNDDNNDNKNDDREHSNSHKQSQSHQEERDTKQIVDQRQLLQTKETILQREYQSLLGSRIRSKSSDWQYNNQNNNQLETIVTTAEITKQHPFQHHNRSSTPPLSATAASLTRPTRLRRNSSINSSRNSSRNASPSPQRHYDVDIIGILNASPKSMTPSEIFKPSLKPLVSQFAPVINHTNINHNHHNHMYNPMNMIRKSNSYTGNTAPATTANTSGSVSHKNIGLNPTNSNNNNNNPNKSFPAIEIQVTLSQDGEDESQTSSSTMTDMHAAPTTPTPKSSNSHYYYNNNNQLTTINSVNVGRGVSTTNEPVSPLTPGLHLHNNNNNEESAPGTGIGGEGRPRHRKMSSSDRLYELLGKVNTKRKSSFVEDLDYRDDDVNYKDADDDADDEHKHNNNHHHDHDCDQDSSSSDSDEDDVEIRSSNRNHYYQNRKIGTFQGGSRSYDSGGSSSTNPTCNHPQEAEMAMAHPSSNLLNIISSISSNVSSNSNNNNHNRQTITSKLSTTSSQYNNHKNYSSLPPPPLSQRKRTVSKTSRNDDPTLHAQSLVLALAFFAVWSPQNLMAPNLTQMAEYFHFSPEQRDLYLGANIAIATGVLSLPVSALLGFLADVVKSRIKLFSGTVCFGGIAAILTGYSQTYTQLYFARFFCGGYMAGSVVIAFSILGDLFDAKDRNAASSGLTAMMGAGILFGQVFAGLVGDTRGWQYPFYVSGICSIVTSVMVLLFVKEPVRGGKEKVLQEMIANGAKYDRKLTLEGFLHAMTKNKTNVILMLQGFFTNVPWGIIFTFLNDYLSQEQGLSVPKSTLLILWFGLGCAAGGVIGGLCGSWCMRINRTLLPLFMAATTLLGTFPFLGLLDLDLNKDGIQVCILLSFVGGLIANLPSVNVRPCLLNVNPPETRGAAMTAANLMINVARGAGPSLITISQKIFGVTRQYSFNITLIVFWSITTLLLIILANTLPYDQDQMESELARYAKTKTDRSRYNKDHHHNHNNNNNNSATEFDEAARLSDIYKNLDSKIFDDVDRFQPFDDDMTVAGHESIVSIEDRMTSFDAAAAQESWTFMEDALREIAQLSHFSSTRPTGMNYETIEDDEDEYNEGGVWDSPDIV